MDEDGFTMLELLTVIVIVGLLAAIAIPSFFLQRDRALDAQAKADARTAQSAAMEVDSEDGSEGSGGITVASLTGVDDSLEGVDLSAKSSKESTLTIRVRSGTGNTFEIRQYPDGTADLICANAGSAGCPSDGTWD